MIRWIRSLFTPEPKYSPWVEEGPGETVLGDHEHFYLMASASDMAQKIRAARKAEAEAAARQQAPASPTDQT